MFEVVFYETREGKSEVWDFMEEFTYQIFHRQDGDKRLS